MQEVQHIQAMEGLDAVDSHHLGVGAASREGEACTLAWGLVWVAEVRDGGWGRKACAEASMGVRPLPRTSSSSRHHRRLKGGSSPPRRPCSLDTWTTDSQDR